MLTSGKISDVVCDVTSGTHGRAPLKDLWRRAGEIAILPTDFSCYTSNFSYERAQEQHGDEEVPYPYRYDPRRRQRSGKEMRQKRDEEEDSERLTKCRLACIAFFSCGIFFIPEFTRVIIQISKIASGKQSRLVMRAVCRLFVCRLQTTRDTSDTWRKSRQSLPEIGFEVWTQSRRFAKQNEPR